MREHPLRTASIILVTASTILFGPELVLSAPWSARMGFGHRFALATPPESGAAAPIQPLPAPPPAPSASKLKLPSLEIVSGVPQISFDEVGSLPLVQAPTALIVADGRTHCDESWFLVSEGTWSIGVPVGYMSQRCLLTRLEGREAFVDLFRYVMPGAELEVTRLAVYAAQAPGEILLMETKRIQGKETVITLLRKEGKLWRYTRTGGAGGEQIRTIDRIDETLENGNHAFFALLRRGQVKPGMKFSYRWFDPESATDQRDGIQLIGTTTRDVEGKPLRLHKVEQVLQRSKLRAEIILDSGSRELVSRIGERLRLRDTEAEVKRELGKSEAKQDKSKIEGMKEETKGKEEQKAGLFDFLRENKHLIAMISIGLILLGSFVLGFGTKQADR